MAGVLGPRFLSLSVSTSRGTVMGIHQIWLLCVDRPDQAGTDGSPRGLDQVLVLANDTPGSKAVPEWD